MTRVIAHRANLHGKNPETENTIPAIQECIEGFGFDVEVDLWSKDNCLFLGHDVPVSQVSEDQLAAYKSKLWVHAKNLSALEFAMQSGYKTFFHNKDKMTLTSSGHIWTLVGERIISPKSIAVILEDFPKELESEFLKCYGICTDYPVELCRQLVEGAL